MGTIEILTPYDRGDVTELSSGLFRKQILPRRSISYTGKGGVRRKIDFNDAYLRDLVAGFRAGAFDEVAVQMADGANTHTLDPERKRASVVSLEMAADGLYALVKPNNEKAAQFLRENPKMGVSARIIEGMDRSDGLRFPRALHHVLITTDPQIPGLKPWAEAESVSLASGDPDETVDLADASYERNESMPKPPAGQTTLTLDQAQADRLTLLLNDDEAAARALFGVIQMTNPAGGSDDPDDDSDESGTGGPDPDQLELTRTQVELANQRITEMSRQLAAAEVATELDRLGQQGLAPAIIEAARPLLMMQQGVVELSNGVDQVDPGAVIRQVLDTVIQLSRSGLDTVNLNRETGFWGEDADSVQGEREVALAAWTAEYGN